MKPSILENKHFYTSSWTSNSEISDDKSGVMTLTLKEDGSSLSIFLSSFKDYLELNEALEKIKETAFKSALKYTLARVSDMVNEIDGYCHGSYSHYTRSSYGLCYFW